MRPSSSAVTVVGKLKTRQKEAGFQGHGWRRSPTRTSLGLERSAAILALACPAPTACYEIYAAFKDGDNALALEKQERVKAGGPARGRRTRRPGVKYAMDLNGYYGGPSRLPSCRSPGEQKAEIEEVDGGH